jgi:hypothetical protein
MSNSAKSVYYFGFYIALIGVVLVFVPNPLLRLAGVPATTEVWIHLAGMLLVFMGFFYIMAGRENVTAFFRWTLVTRSVAVLFVAGFVLMDWISPVIILFWLGDLAGALWTLQAMRKDAISLFPNSI